MKKVVIYTGPLCGYCDAAKTLLKKKNISFDEIDIGENQKKRDEMLKKSNGAQTIPQIFIGNNHIGGFHQLYALEKENKLESLLKN
jgi:glutaredoxin 3